MANGGTMVTMAWWHQGLNSITERSQLMQTEQGRPGMWWLGAVWQLAWIALTWVAHLVLNCAKLKRAEYICGSLTFFQFRWIDILEAKKIDVGYWGLYIRCSYKICFGKLEFSSKSINECTGAHIRKPNDAHCPPADGDQVTKDEC